MKTTKIIIGLACMFMICLFACHPSEKDFVLDTILIPAIENETLFIRVAD
jgi:hypothetical protein